ncbi:MAG: glycosyltransferase family 2 protein [Propionibacteriaceae bacterium]|nr:glycosyltransferase family 2 protein [Propionibacteriaceae bacterium]
MRSQRVTAVLVVRNGADWLPDTLTALSRLVLRPSLIIAVDNQSDDGSAQLLEAARRSGIIDRLLPGLATASFGESVARASVEFPPGNQWLWFLHDDAAPDPNALAELLTFALRTPRLALAYPLLVRPTRRRHTPLTLELGSSISGTGRRHLTIDPGEAAQGQYEPTATLGGSTCGVLASQTAFDALHGFSSTIPSYRDGLDLGWRANLAGYSVMTCPTAQFTHHQAGRSERRVGTIAASHHRSETAWDRLMGMRLVAAHASGVRAILTWLKLVLSALLRALGFLLDKAPDQARDEIEAVSDFVRSGTRVQRLRRRLARIDTRPELEQRIDRLRPPWWSAFVSFFHTIGDMIRSAVGSGQEQDLLLDDLLGDQFESRANDRPQRIPRWVWALVVVVTGLIAGRTLFAVGPVRAEHLLAAPDTLVEAFHTALASPAGGEAAPAPWLLLEAVCSILFVRPNWFVVGLLFLSVPLTGLVAAWYLRHHLGQHKRMSWVLALLYALVPMLLGGFNRGELWLAVLAVLLPFFVVWLSRWSDQVSGVKGWQPAAGVAVALIMVVPMVPVLWLPAAVAVAVTVFRAGGGTLSWIRAGVAVFIPLVMWGDWLWSLLLDSPGRLLTAPSPLLGETTTTPAWQLLLGRIQAGGLPPLWISAVVFGLIWVAAIVAMIRVPRLRAGVVGGFVCLTVGVALSRFTITIDTSRSMPDAAPWVLIGFAVLLGVVAAYLNEGDKLVSRDFGLAQALVGVLSVVVLVAVGISLVWWAWGGVRQVTRGEDPRIPYFVAQGEVIYGVSSLIVDQAGDRTRWSIRSGGRPSWGAGEARSGALASPQAWQRAQQIVAQIEVGRFDETMTAELARMGVRYIVIIAPKPDTAGSLEAATGLGTGSTSNNGSTLVYQMLSEPTSIQVVSGTESALSLVPAESPLCQDGQATCRVGQVGPEALLLLSQPPSSGLVVTVGGVRLEPAESPDWRAAFSLDQAQVCQSQSPDTGQSAEPTPAGCGLVEINQVIEHRPWRFVQLVLGFLAVLFALPSATARSAVARSPRRAQGDSSQEEVA